MSTVDVTQTEDAPVTLDTNGEVTVQDGKDINPQSTEWNTTSDVNPDAVSETGMVEEAKESLEAYLSILEAAGKDGISLQTQAVMNVHLRSIDRKMGYTKVTPALECVDASPRTALYKSTISIEDIKDRLSNVGTKLKEMFKKLLEWLQERITGGKAKIAKLKAAAGQLGEKIKNIGSTTDSGEKIEITDRNLFVNNKLELGIGYDMKYLDWFTSKYLIWIGKGVMLVDQNAGDKEKLQSVFDSWLTDAPPADFQISGNSKIVYKEGTGKLVVYTDGDDPDPVSSPIRSKEELLRADAEYDKFNGMLNQAYDQMAPVLEHLRKVGSRINNTENADFALSILAKVVSLELMNTVDRESSIYFSKLKQISVEIAHHDRATKE